MMKGLLSLVILSSFLIIAPLYAEDTLQQRVRSFFEQQTPERRNEIMTKISIAIEKTESYPVRKELLLMQDALLSVIAFQSWWEYTKFTHIVESAPDELYTLWEISIDLAVLRRTWLWWVNTLRKERWLTAISHDTTLDMTAKKRSEEMFEKWLVDHKRTSKSAYYAYYEIEERFRDLGVEFKNVSRATFVENIGRPYLKCPSGDCTDATIKAMRTTFDFYVAEAWTKNDAHRRTLIHPQMKIMGLGIVVDTTGKRLYFTTHYGTELQ